MKDLIQGNPYSHGMRKKETGTSRVAPKRKRAWEDSNPIPKEIVEDMDRLFVQQDFQLHANFNGTIFNGPLFLFDLSRRMSRTALYQSILKE